MNELGYVSPKKNDKPNEQSNSLEYWNWNKIILSENWLDRNHDLFSKKEWCKDYTSDKWFVNLNGHFFFKNEDDATLFKLSW